MCKAFAPAFLLAAALMAGCAGPVIEAPALMSRAEIDALALQAGVPPDTAPLEARAARLEARAAAMRRQSIGSLEPSPALLRARADQLATE